jgi:hypothetical protein
LFDQCDNVLPLFGCHIKTETLKGSRYK